MTPVYHRANRTYTHSNPMENFQTTVNLIVWEECVILRKPHIAEGKQGNISFYLHATVKRPQGLRTRNLPIMRRVANPQSHTLVDTPGFATHQAARV